jgi:hypothetical protein
LSSFEPPPNVSVWGADDDSPRGGGALGGTERLAGPDANCDAARSPTLTPPRGSSVMYPYMLELDMNVGELNAAAAAVQGRLAKLPSRQVRAHRSIGFQAI